MRWKKLLAYCEKNGINMTRMGLYVAGRKHKFIKTNEYGTLVFDKDNFKKWLRKRNEEVPEGFVPIKDCAAIWKKSLVWTYHVVEKHHIETRKIGARGKIYVNEKQFKKYLRECY